MITTLLIKILSLLLTVIMWAIPNWFIPMPLTDAFTSVINDAMKMNGVFPIADVMFCLSLVLFFHILKFTYNQGMGFLSLLRGGGSNRL